MAYNAAAVLCILTGALASLLPEKHRPRALRDLSDVKLGGTITAAAEIIAGVALLASGYTAYVSETASRLVTSSWQHNVDLVPLQVGGLTLTALASYLITPRCLFAEYIAFEGVVRLLAVVGAGEIIPILPFALVQQVESRGRRRLQRWKQGPPVPDLVVEEGSGIIIASCRPKSWTNLTTIVWKDQMYELADAQNGASPRPFIYRLTARPEGKIIRGIHRFSPDECMRETTSV